MDRLRLTAAGATESLRSARDAARAESEALERYKQDAESAHKAQSVLQSVAAAVQSKAHEQITAVVNKCLATVVPEMGYTFRIDFVRRRGRTDAEMRFVRNGVRVNPTESDSGGVTEIAAFGLRLACLMLARPERRRLLVLDEPFTFIHGRKYQRRVASLVESLADELDVQLLIVTGLEWLRLGNIIEVE